MAVTHDSSVGGSVWSVAVDHLAVLWDAVSVCGWDVALSLLGLVLGWGPGEVVSSDLDVIVGEFSELVIIHTQKLSLLRSTELETWDGVDAVGEDGGDDECVCGAGDDVGNLDVELLPVVVEPPTVDDTGVDTIETDYVVGGEEGVEDETDHTSDTVLSEDIEGIVNANPELDCENIRFCNK